MKYAHPNLMIPKTLKTSFKNAIINKPLFNYQKFLEESNKRSKIKKFLTSTAANFLNNFYKFILMLIFKLIILFILYFFCARV